MAGAGSKPGDWVAVVRDEETGSAAPKAAVVRSGEIFLVGTRRFGGLPAWGGRARFDTRATLRL